MQPQTTFVSVGTQIVKVEEAQTTKTKDEKEDEDEKKQVSLIYPWEHMQRVARGAEKQPHNLLPLQEDPTGRNNQSIKIHKLFSYPEVQKIKRDLEDYLEAPEKYTEAFMGLTLLSELTWRDMMNVLGQNVDPDLRA